MEEALKIHFVLLLLRYDSSRRETRTPWEEEQVFIVGEEEVVVVDQLN